MRIKIDYKLNFQPCTNTTIIKMSSHIGIYAPRITPYSTTTFTT